MNNENNNSFNFKKLSWGWILLGITLWFLFPWIYSVLFDFIIRNPESYGSRFGAVGDIYGSLNAFVSSVALCAVAYSTWLQVTSLKETRETNKIQLDFAKKVHDDQIKETKYSNFLNIYNSLMNYKLTKYNALQIRIDEGEDKNIWYAEEIFKEISLYFLGQKKIFDLSLLRNQVGDLYNGVLAKIAGADKGLNEINSYFLIYGSLFELINHAEISDEDKSFFRKTVSNSMSKHEQLTLLWASVDIRDLNDLVKNTGIFNQFYNANLMPFLVKFFDKSCFSHTDILKNWDDYLSKQTPT